MAKQATGQPAHPHDPPPPAPGEASASRLRRLWEAAASSVSIARATVLGARFELAWIAYGAALLALSVFNEYHGLTLSLRLPIIGLNLGLVVIAAGVFLLLTRGPVPARDPTTKPDWLARGGAMLLLAGLAAEAAGHVTGALSSVVAGGVFLPDLAVLFGGGLFAWRASRPALPRGPIFTASALMLAAGALVALVHNHLARAPFFEAYTLYAQDVAGASLTAAAASVFNPLASLAAAGASAAEILHLSELHKLGLSQPNPVLALFPSVALLGLLGIAWSSYRRAPATTVGEPRPGAVAIVLVAAGLLYLPTLGAYGFFDPWEGHYAEVGRQMFARDDWVSLFWYDNWFWSKPVGVFWMMAASFKVFGVSDFAARLPFAITGIAGVYFVYYFCRKIWSARAGVIAAVVLACFPQYLFISRQVMTDIPVAVLMLIGTGLLFLALVAKDEDELERRPLTLLFMAIFAATTLPQYGMLASELERFGVLHALVYLGSWILLVLAISRARKARQIYAYGFYLCIGLGCLAKGLIAPGLPVIVLLGYLVCTGDWGDFFKPRRLFTGLVGAVLAFVVGVLVIKLGFGIAGPVFSKLLLSLTIVSAVVGLLTMAATAKGGAFARLEVGKGLVIFLITALPWYVAMAARHGGAVLDANSFGGFRFTGFLQEFIVQHHFNRIGGGVHGDTNTTFEYFVRWGAYACFPWVAFVPAALGRFWGGAEGGRNAVARSARLFVFVWFAVFFTIFTLSATKFHHYILPALPPLAIMLGVWLDRAADSEIEIGRAALVGAIGVLIFVGRDLIKDPQAFFNSFTYVFSGRHYAWPEDVIASPFLKLLVLTGAAVLVFGMIPRPKRESTIRWLRLGWVVVFLGLLTAGLLSALSPVAPKLASAKPEEIKQIQQGLSQVMPIPPVTLIHDYVRHLPHDRFWLYAGKVTGRIGDYGWWQFAGFLAIIALAGIYGLGRRRVALAIFGGLALIMALWSAHWYMPELSEGSGQRHMFEVYYAKRAGPQERICAYMMNWRSEHWYSKNKVWVALNDARLLEHARRPGRQWLMTERHRLSNVRTLLNRRHKVCRKVVEWDLFSNRYTLATLVDDPSDPEVRRCLSQR